MAAGNSNVNLDGYPDYSSFVLVGSTTSSDARSSFSNYGIPIDVMAPGSSIYATNMGGGYTYASGTSMASPVAAGVAALMWSANPTLTPAELETHLFESCDDLGAAGEDGVYGFGRVNAYQSVLAALNGAPPVAYDDLVVVSEGASREGTFSATDSGDDPLTFAIVTNGSYGTAIVTEPAAGAFTYSVGDGTAGNLDSFTFRVSNGSQDSNVATVTVAIVGQDGILPAPGSVLSAASVNFYWGPVSGATEYSISAGGTAGGSEYFVQNTGENSYASVSGLPRDGSTVYVRVSARVGGSWQDLDYDYVALDVAAAVTSPTPGSILESDEVQFSWSAGTGANEYWLRVGTTPGGLDIFNASTGTALTRTVAGLPIDGSSVYVKLYTRIGSDWPYNEYTFTAVTDEYGGLAFITSPVDQSVLTGSSETFTWSAGSGVTEYWLRLGSSLGGRDIFDASTGSNTSRTVANLPTDGGTVYARLYSRKGGNWPYLEFTYTAHASDDGDDDGGGGDDGDDDDTSIAQLTSPAPSSTLSSSSATFTWTAGTGVSEYWLRVGTTPGGLDLFNASTGTALSRTVGNLPVDGSTVYVRLYSRQGGSWPCNEYTLTAHTSDGGGGDDGGGDDRDDEDTTIAQLTSPAPSSTLSSSSATLAWTAGTGVSEYWLRIGTTPGGLDLFNASTGTALSRTVGNLPVDGSTVYVKLYSRQGGNWPYNEYSLTAHTGDDLDEDTTIACLAQPSPDSTLAGPSASFAWTAGSGISEYWLRIGSTPGGRDVYDASAGVNLSRTLTGLPVDGRTLYVKLYSKRGALWPYNEYALIAAGP